MDIEQEVKPLEGYRLYTLTKDFQLQGSHSSIWEGTSLTAECPKNTPNLSMVDPMTNYIASREAAHDHLSRGECQCGIYVVKDNTNHGLWRSAIEERTVHVEAKVRGYGICVEGELGVYRCETVTIYSLKVLAVPCNQCHTTPSEYFNLAAPFGQLCAICYMQSQETILLDAEGVTSYKFRPENAIPLTYVRWDILGRAIELNYPNIEVELEPLYSGNNSSINEYPLKPDTIRNMAKARLLEKGYL